MKLGLALPHAGPLASPANLVQAATEAERIGLDSVWVLDRVLRPRGTALPDFYATVFDPIDTLAYVAAHTRKVQLGTSVVLALLHPPVLLARRLATLDQLSEGRLVAGLGQGWMPEEFAVAGVPMSRRGQGMAEYVRVLRAVWGPDPVCFDGETYRIPESEIGPKPFHPTGIPLLMGYGSDAGLRLAARVADGLNPNRSSFEELRRDIELFRRTAEAAGRDASALPVVLRAAARLERSHTKRDEGALFVGSVSQWAEDVERVAGLGVHHVFLGLHEPLEEQLAAMTELRARVI